MTEPVDDPWRMKEWNALSNICFIEGCESPDVDQRGPIFLRDGSIHKACQDHWEAVISILREQSRRTDSARWSPNSEARSLEEH